MSANRNNSLNPRQARFVEEYLVDLNGSAACIRAGYSPRGASVTASQLLRLPKVSRAVEAAKRARSAAVGVDAEFVLVKLREILDRTMAEITPAIDRKGKPMRDGDGNPVYKFDAANALRSLELLGRHVNVQAYRDRVDVNDGASIIAALMAGRKRAAGLPIDVHPSIGATRQSAVAQVLQAGRRRAALPQPDSEETNAE